MFFQFFLTIHYLFSLVKRENEAIWIEGGVSRP